MGRLKEEKYYAVLSAIGHAFCNLIMAPWWDIKSKMYYFKKAKRLMKKNQDVIKRKTN